MTIKDIAKQSGYGMSTVSRVLNGHSNVSEESKAAILAVVEANDFQLNNNAKHLKQKQSATLAIIVKGAMNPLFASIVEPMQEQIKQAGYQATVHYLEEEDNEVAYAHQLCRERRPQGLLFLGGWMEHFRHGFHKIALPSVLVTLDGSGLDFSNLSSVSIDDVAAGDMAITHLLQHGHQNIGIIAGHTERSSPAKLRLQGATQALTRHNLPLLQVQEARYTQQSGYDAMCALLERMPELSAVFCMADVMALGALRALVDHGKRVPEDISLVGFDGISAGNFSIPRLTTITQNVQQLTEESVEMLCQMIQNPSPPQHGHLPFSLHCGESTSQRWEKKETT